MPFRREFVRMAAAIGVMAVARPLVAEAAAEPDTAAKKYAPGITDTEIKIGQAMPYSGPISSFATVGRAEHAYFKMINENGGINGRKITLISLDDAFDPAKTVEQTRRLIEQDQVAFIFQTLGDNTNAAVQHYLNDRHIPQLFLGDGSARFADPEHFPWSMAFLPSFQTEGRVDAKYILDHKPEARIAVLGENSIGGREELAAIEEVLGERAKRMIVKRLTYEHTDPTIDSQIVLLQDSGADTFVQFSSPKFAVQAIRKIYDIGWKPLHILFFGSSSPAVLKLAGLDKCVGIVSVAFLKFPDDPQWKNDPAIREWSAWMDKYYPEGDKSDGANVYACAVSQALVQVLKQCADDLSRENIMRQSANLHDLELPLLLPGIRINTSPTDYRPIKQMQPMRFNGRNWDLFGDLITG